MSSVATKTPGQELAATLRRILAVGTRTRRYRKTADLHRAMIETIQVATTYPGCYSGDADQVLQSAWAVCCSYSKHVEGYRIPGALHRHISELSPWRFAELLGRMIDAGVTNVGEGERFFAEMARDIR